MTTSHLALRGLLVLLAGLPLIVSDLREQARFVREQGVGTVFAPGDAADLARAVRDLLARRAELTAAATAASISSAPSRNPRFSPQGTITGVPPASRTMSG